MSRNPRKNLFGWDRWSHPMIDTTQNTQWMKIETLDVDNVKILKCNIFDALLSAFLALRIGFCGSLNLWTIFKSWLQIPIKHQEKQFNLHLIIHVVPSQGIPIPPERIAFPRLEKYRDNYPTCWKERKC